jgi:hypothetical protein
MVNGENAKFIVSLMVKKGWSRYSIVIGQYLAADSYRSTQQGSFFAHRIKL